MYTYFLKVIVKNDNKIIFNKVQIHICNGFCVILFFKCINLNLYLKFLKYNKITCNVIQVCWLKYLILVVNSKTAHFR